jgi:hypothetical protein
MNEQFIVKFQVFDQSLVSKDNELKTVEVHMVSSKREELPMIQRIGDFIRVHKANIIIKGSQKTIFINMEDKASWCLFIGNDNELPLTPQVSNEDGTHNYYSYTPYSFSGKSYTIQPDEVGLTRKMKNWSKRYFKLNYVTPFEVEKDKIRKYIADNKPFSLFGKIIDITEEEKGSIEYQIRDSTKQLWKITVPDDRFKYVRLNHIIKIKNVKSNEDNVLKLMRDTTFLKFFTHAKIRNHLLATIKAKRELRTVVTRFTNEKYNDLQIMSLK